MNDTMVDIFSQDNDNVEVITDQDVNQVNVINNNVINQEPINNITYEEVKPKKKKDKVLMVQLILLAAWAIITALVYFFGYDFFEPYISIK